MKQYIDYKPINHGHKKGFTIQWLVGYRGKEPIYKYENVGRFELQKIPPLAEAFSACTIRDIQTLTEQQIAECEALANEVLQ